MPKRWSKEVELIKYKELKKLYVTENKSIGEIAKHLNLSQSTVYDRLLRLGIKPTRWKKLGFNNRGYNIKIPKVYSKELAEFIGILLGDGHLSSTQVIVTLGNKEKSYVNYVGRLISKIFKIRPKIMQRSNGYRIVYFGSTDCVRWFLAMGLVSNKVKDQVDVPTWIFSKKDYFMKFLRGFFDTDGSVYKLRFGVQLAFTNKSLPLLRGVRRCLDLAGYCPSKISLFRVYVTQKPEVKRFFTEVGPANIKHSKRFRMFVID